MNMMEIPRWTDSEPSTQSCSTVSSRGHRWGHTCTQGEPRWVTHKQGLCARQRDNHNYRSSLLNSVSRDLAVWKAAVAKRTVIKTTVLKGLAVRRLFPETNQL
jgi:hypothetical protein